MPNHDGRCQTCNTSSDSCPNELGETCCLPCYERTLAGLFDRRVALRDRWERESASRQSLAHTGFLLDQNARDVADHPELAALLGRCACGCSPEMHVGEIGCPCGLPDERPCVDTFRQETSP